MIRRHKCTCGSTSANSVRFVLQHGSELARELRGCKAVFDLPPFPKAVELNKLVHHVVADVEDDRALKKRTTMK